MPARIHLLPADVANQIAAGEVVERPASVVKELVENALDAGARAVTVSVDGGGIARIAVTDDGAGMSADDLRLAVVRHATSKITTADDLIGVATYGFRGEALPSIGSVSKLKITSRARESDEGAEVTVEGGAEATLRPVGCAPGTTVAVEDLFYNTPARRKFLRTPQTEWGACADTVVRLALPRPDVRFVLRRDGKTTRELLRHDDVAQRVREAFPDETLADLRGARGTLKLTALLGPPERARSGAAGIALYVNGRHVRDRLLLRAVAQAYGSVLEPGRYPVGAVLVEVPPHEVDVNVHPQKTEVRFAQSNEVFAAIMTVLRAALGSAPWARSAAGGGGGSDFWTSRFSGGPRPDEGASGGAAAASVLFGASSAVQPPAPAPAHPTLPFDVAGAAAPGAASAPGAATSAPAASTSEGGDPWGLTPAALATAAVSYAAAAAEAATGASAAVTPAVPAAASAGAAPVREELFGAGTFGALRFVAQMRRMFLVCESDLGMVLLDQHAAAERVTFDRLRRAYAARAVAVQPLLVPETVEVTARDVALAEERAADLARIGIELTPLGPTTLTVRAVPALLTRADPRRVARDVLAELGRHGNDFSRALDLVLATMACHGSVRGGDALADEEARALLRALDDVDFAGHCPHGRPVVWSVRWTELERRLGR